MKERIPFSSVTTWLRVTSVAPTRAPTSRRPSRRPQRLSRRWARRTSSECLKRGRRGKTNSPHRPLALSASPSTAKCPPSLRIQRTTMLPLSSRRHRPLIKAACRLNGYLSPPPRRLSSRTPMTKLCTLWPPPLPPQAVEDLRVQWHLTSRHRPVARIVLRLPGNPLLIRRSHRHSPRRPPPLCRRRPPQRQTRRPWRRSRTR